MTHFTQWSNDQLIRAYSTKCSEIRELQKNIADNKGEYSRAIEKAKKLDENETQLITERDNLEQKATELANLIGKYLNVYIGEHTSANCPIQNAINALKTS